MSCLNFKTFVLKYRYSNNFKTIFLTVQSVSQVFIILEIYNLGKCMCVSVTCFLSTSLFSLYHSTMVRWGTLNLKTDGVWFILPFFFLQLNICLWKNNKRCFLSFCHLQLRSQVYIKVVYICSSICLLAVGSRDLSQAEKKLCNCCQT